MRICDELHTVENLVYMCPALDTTNCIPRWHQCTYRSSSGRLSYTLAICVSLTWTEEVIFDFEYTIHTDHYRPYRSAKRIMLRPYMDAFEMIRDDNDQFPPLRLMSCEDCDIVPPIKGGLKLEVS
jgi:hypothetical protein